MKAPFPRKRKTLAAALFAAGVLMLCFSPWAGKWAGLQKEVFKYTDTRSDKVYAIVSSTEVPYFNINNRRALLVMNLGVLLSSALMFSGVFYYLKARREELALLAD